MQQTKVIATLKRLLKADGIKYVDVAKALDLSEASVKRLLSQGDMSLSRLEQICQMMSLSLTDFFAKVEQSKRITEVSAEQEQEIVSDIKLLLVTSCVINHWSYSNILKYYELSEYELIERLRYLDKINLIDYLPNNRIKLKVSTNFRWQVGGPVMQFFQQSIKREFFQSQFAGDDERLLFRFGMMTKPTNAQFLERLTALADEFSQQCDKDADKPFHQRYGSVLVMALRPWVPSVLSDLQKKE